MAEWTIPVRMIPEFAAHRRKLTGEREPVVMLSEEWAKIYEHVGLGKRV